MLPGDINRPKGSGFFSNTGPGPSSLAYGQSATSTPTPVSTIRPRFENNEFSFPRILKGQPNVAVINETARDGGVKKILGRFLGTFVETGSRVEQIMTVEDEVRRHESIALRVGKVLRDHPTSRITIWPLGGDGTAGDAFEGGIAGEEIVNQGKNSTSTSRQLSRLTFGLINQGTAGDLPYMFGAPKKPEGIPDYYRSSVDLPWRRPELEIPPHSPNEKTLRRKITHSWAQGPSSLLFAKRKQNRDAYLRDPGGNWLVRWWRKNLNQGIPSYARLLPYALFNRYGLVGVEVELIHTDRQGRVRWETLRASEIMVTPNRIISKYGGVPGAWGETKVLVIPPAPRGIVPLLEFIGRGVLTKLGWNAVGPQARIRTLSQERQMSVGPGEWMEVQIRVPQSLSLGSYRPVHDFLVQMGLANPMERIPQAGESYALPAILNGDVMQQDHRIKNFHRFIVRGPSTEVSVLADPRSFAVSHARESALEAGELPPVSDQALMQRLHKDPEAKILEYRPGIQRIRTQWVSQNRLGRLLQDYRIGYIRLNDLIGNAQLDPERQSLSGLSNHELSIEGLETFLNGPSGEKWRSRTPGALKSFGTRTIEGGVPLGAGIAAIFGAELLADQIGLDPIGQREIRFGMVVGLSHAVNVNTAPFWEVISNRVLRRPYDFIRPENFRVKGEIFSRWHYERHHSWTKALGSSWKSGSLGFLTGMTWLQRSKALAGTVGHLPWSMGTGLIFSRITENLVEGLPEDSSFRKYSPTAAFFAPEVARIIHPGAAARVLQSRPLRWTAGAVGLGFFGDMAYTGIHRLAHGGVSIHEQQLNHRAAALRRQEGDIGSLSWRNVMGFLAPSLGAHIDSHEYFFGGDNKFLQRVRGEDWELAREVRITLKQDLRPLAEILEQPMEEVLGSKLELSPLEKRMLEHLEYGTQGKKLSEGASFFESARYLQRRFRGKDLSEEQVNRHLAQIQLYQLQGSIRYLKSLSMSHAMGWGGYFDREGILKTQATKQFVQWLS